jgi:hypothetical protein
MQYYRARYFGIYELVDQPTYERFGEAAWEFFRPEALFSLDSIRDYFNKPAIVNDWHLPGSKSQVYTDSGLRIRNEKNKDIYSPYSAHSMGCAFDVKIQGMPAEEARQAILDHKNDEPFQYIMRLETGVSWLHFDTFNVLNRIVLFSK